MRICVYGAGAIGGNFAARLAASGNEVSVVVRGAHLEAIRAKGLTLIAGDRKITVKVHASDDPSELGQQDAVISTLKATGLPALAESVGPLLGPDTPVVFAQNGIPWWYGYGLPKSRPPAPDLSRLDPGGALLKAVGPGRTLGGAITSPNHVVEPGVIVNEIPDRNTLWVAEIDDRQSQRVGALRAALKGAGIGSPDTTDIRYDIWHKLMANLTGSAVCLILGQPSLVQKTPIVNQLCRRAHAEALAVAAAHGIVLDDSPDVRYGPKRVYFDHRPSILQDYDLGRPMEIESIIRAPVAFARSAGVPTPTLDAIEAFGVSLAAAKGLYTP
ncbi:MAG: 2-dehydropantoate 2-reductase [Reyranella sp.]|uniref:ketopantoate reductase family protein n=1 Tax=Reyranella sp. TaxID=1929291 RepID=UPI001AC8CA8D|nr:2-dehydropantoate 2-reductase [Reyranella sp.]MBN9087959.1 2-dehydropantoate 2-reductase [Reyranella sp.]